MLKFIGNLCYLKCLKALAALVMGISYLHSVARKSKDRDEHVHYFGFCSLLSDLRESWRQSQPGLQLLPTAHRKLDLPKVVGSVVVFSFLFFFCLFKG